MDEVKMYMSEASVTIEAKGSVWDTVKLMKENAVGAILITEDDKFIGIFTETDLLRKVVAEEKSLANTKIGSVMCHPLISIDAKSNMLRAFYVMQQRNIRHLTVTENGKVIGILSIKDIANYYIGKFGKKVDKVNRTQDEKDK
ncbi:MAG: histidine kinase [Nitrospinae bacterium CG11_big_fil_rev_8_21_14_0_20_45_15]|nr:MAG: histidine kinase [Nitrospinae bacterium CG11_big_fil_rev_8_21_14_0_20_45_15]